ncbi:MAG: pyridoxal phosphate-dependent aminotransferase [Candidatus Levyibacteriota bacterium]|nr:MAG: pyridoxal phosphate-dependent aminotransferase [Candidatus Levybacteria bacterium]
MKQTDKKKTHGLKGVSSVVSSIEVSAIKRVQNLASSLKDVVSLAQGTPSFFTPDYIKNAIKDAMDKNLTDKYTIGFGIDPLRAAIVNKLKKDNGIVVEKEQIIVTHGGIEGLMAVFMTLLDPDDEMIVLTPDYASHITQVKIALGGKSPTFVPLQETSKGWVLDPARIEKAINRHTKAILFCNPCNPTGKVFTKAELKEIVRIALKHNLYIISDEIYEYFLYDGREHFSTASFPEVADRTISVFGVSKSYSMTGWRIGYLVANKTLASQIFKIHDSLVTCPTAASQYGAIAAINGPKNEILRFKKEYEKRRQICIEELSKTDKLEFSAPEGAYYIFPKFKKPIDDFKFCFEMVEKAGVALVPGSAFGKRGENHVRITYCYAEDTLREGLHRFVKYINKHL